MSLQLTKELTAMLREEIRLEHRLDLEQAKILAQETFRHIQAQGRSPEMAKLVAALMFEGVVRLAIKEKENG